MDTAARLAAVRSAAVKVGGLELRVMAVLAADADNAGQWSGKYAALAALLGCSWSSVARAFAALVRAGCVRKVAETQRGAVWQICDSSGATYGIPDMAAMRSQPPHTPPSSPTPSSSPSAHVPIPPPPARQVIDVRDSDGGGGGGGMANVPYHKKGYVKSLDGSDAPDSAGVRPLSESESARLALVPSFVADPGVRADLARRATEAELRHAAAAVAKAKNARDPGALFAHVVRSGAARAAVLKDEHRRAVDAERQAQRVEAGRRTLAAAEAGNVTTAAQLSAIGLTPVAALRSALAELAAGDTTQARAVRGSLARARVNLDDEDGVRRAAALPFVRALVAESLARSAAPGVRFVPETEGVTP